jgi:hypothetical protein
MATDDKKLIRIKGRVIEGKTKQGLSSLRVEAWDKELRVKEVVASAVTDPQGSFQMEFEEAPFRKLFLNRKPLLFFKVFRGDQLVASTEASAVWDADKADSEVVIKLDTESPKTPDKTFTLSGEVCRADGSVFQEGFVQALITTQGQQRILGETKPDAKGRFEIPYTLDDSQVSQLANGRIIARALDSQRIQLAESLFIPFIPVAVKITIPNPPPVKTLSVQGQVRRQDGAGSPIGSAIVQAFITTPEKEILLGEAQTDSLGKYAITFATDQIPPPVANARLQARVLDKQGKILAASSSPIKEGVTTIDLVVPLQPPDEPSNVHGQVRQANGKPLDVGTVRIFGAAPGPEQLLGETTITKNDEGRYRIKYQPGAFSPKLSDATRVVIRVFDNQNRLLVSSPLLRAELDATVDLTMSGNVAEPPFVVRGQVTRSGDGGNAGNVVRIFGISGSQEKKLGPDAITDDAGRYEISYEAGEFNPSVNPAARVIVRVFDRQEKVLVSSEPFNAQPVKVIDLVVTPAVEEKPFIVRGQVLKSDGTAFIGGAVRAFHEALTGQTPLGEDNTNSEGRYSISYSARKVTGPINLRVQVQDGSGTQLVQSDLIAGAKREEIVNLTIPTAKAANVVKGQLVQTDGTPFVKAIVQAHDRDLRSEQLLGRAVTDNTGHYEISYTSSQFARAEKDSADLLVRAYKDERAIAANEPIASSNIVFNAKEVETVDLVVGNAELRGPSEYEQIEAALRPLLEGVSPAPNVQVATLTDEDIAFLVGETGIALQHISFFVAAARLGKTTGLAPEIFYGFARQKLPTTLDLLLAETSETLRRALEAAIRENIIPASVASLIDSALVDLAGRVGVVPPLKLDELAGILKLDPGVVQKLKEKNLALEDVGEATLVAMVSEKIISPAQKKEIQLTVGLSKLSGENLALTKALKTVVQESPVELVRWNRADWLKLLQEQKIQPAPGETDLNAYAENLRDVVEQSFPSEYFLHRIVNGDTRAKIGGLVTAIAPLFQNNPTIIPTDTVESPNYDWKGISEENRKEIQSRLAELTPVVNAYRSLGVAEILNQRDMNAAQKQGVIEKRFASLGTFYNNNPAIDLQYADFSTTNSETKKDQWIWQGIDAAEQPYVKKQMAATQRVFTVAGNYETADLLVKKGFDSACAITSMTEDDFLVRSGLGWEKGKAVYVRANEMAVASAHYYEAIRDVARGVFRDIALNNQNASLVNDLKEIDGYEELFGNQNYCDCEACKSILSPAAYFVDLMYFVNENVSKKLFIPSLVNHPLYLKNRRPDLWTLKLSCDNTNTEIPYLQVVIEVLEKYLAQVLTTNVAGVYETLRTSDLSCRQPFNLALEETRLFLSHFDLSLAEIYKTLKQPKAAQYREQLLLSVEELQIILKVDPTGAKKRFEDIALADFDVQEFIRLAGISRSELDDLLATEFDPSMAQVKVKMVKLGADIQQFHERLTGLTGDNLDVIHRYLRLWKKTTWTLPEFDLLLSAMKAKGLLSTLEENDSSGQPKVLQLAQIKTLQQQLDRTAEEMATIIYRLPQAALRDNSLPLYNRIFDLEKIFEVASIDADGVKTYKSTAILPFDKAADKETPLIIAGLGITESELQSLFKSLGLDKPIDQTIDIDLLSLLYRYAAIARGLKLGIEDFLHLVSVFLGAVRITQLSQIETLVEAVAWLKTSPFTISELLLIIEGETSSALQFTNDIQVVSAAVFDIQTGAATDKKDKEDLLEAYLQRSFNLTTDQLQNEFFPKLLSLNLLSPTITKALNASFTNGKPDNPADLDAAPGGLLTLMHELERQTLLFEKAKFDADMISFMLANPAVFGIADLRNPGVSGIANIVRYQALLKDKDEQREALNLALQHIQGAGQFPDADIATLAEAWKQPASLIASVAGSLTFSLPALEAISYLQDGLSRCLMLGIQGDALVKLKHSDKDGLLAARDIVVGAFASKYADEKTRNEKLEPYNDKLNTLKRDALCDYIISRSASLKFKDRNDLYNYFLLDVEMSGCFRTSYLVAAITSLQLYVHRCLINLEQSSPTLNPGVPDVKVIPGWIPGDEWEWRKNYRVWEANRKVFLYPENYIDPTLRDNKTEIFKELEDELLQQKISQESAEAAYKKYLSQFAELTRLRFAGGYYHHVSNGMGFLDLSPALNFAGGGVGAGTNMQEASNAYYFVSAISLEKESDESLFYLFGRTNVHPYRYSYRTYNHYKQVWTSWKSIDLGIEAAEISTIIYLGKLYIYWTEVQCKELNKIIGGASTSDGFLFKAYVKYSFLDENGKWSAPQRFYIGQNYVDEETLFRRVWKGVYPDSTSRDKAHDSTVEKFQELVFRKPYATIVSDIKQPIALQHIWSHKKSESKVRYTTGDITNPTGFYTFNVPSQTFVVTNDDFDLAVVTTNATITYPLFHDQVFNTTAVVRLIDSGHCHVRFDNPGFSFVAQISSQHDELTTEVTTNATNVSLSRNAVTNLKQGDMLDGAADISSAPSLQREFNKAFSENETIGYYIESGSKSLTSHFVSQTPENDATLFVENGSKLDHVSLSTILTDELSDILFAKGLEELLSLTTQKLTDDHGQQFDFKGAYGEYYWELFFHMPFLIADHLNANQKFKEAKWWYDRIFDPTAEEKPDDLKKTDHNWQFREFRGLDIQKLKDILTDSKAIEAYKKDPFNPHAIARLRLSAYQKTIVMHYIDNLLDWGDYLFTQDTRESINEAEMLYQLAFDILGKRPIKVGKCETADENKLTYALIEPQIGKGSEFLIQLENYHLVQKQTYAYEKNLAQVSKNIESITARKFNGQKSFAEIARKSAFTSIAKMTEPIPGVGSNLAVTQEQTDPYAGRVKSYKETTAKKLDMRENLTQWTDSTQYIFESGSNSRFKTTSHFRTPGYDLVKQYSMVFCVPPNDDLLKYWDRVEDRLFKIRNCMNIKGIRRSLSLFQPPIDPMLLVRARAAGLSLEDIAAMISGAGKLPAYRFTYLVEKAKQFTQTLQSFGSALLSALEKKDGEELTLLRSVHEKNILKLTTNIKRKQLQDAQYQYKASEAALVNVQNRLDYYQGLIDTGLIPWEVTEQVSKWTGSGIRITEATLGFLSSAFGFLPQVGSPFAMKYGGKELNAGMNSLMKATGTLADIADNIAILAGLEASHKRREQDWGHQLKLAQQELKQSSIQLLAAEIRQQIAEQDLTIHDKNMEQADELFDFYKNKFTSLGLYNYMASTLNRLYRNAYNIAYDLAKQAEAAYHHELYTSEVFIQADNWQFDRAGLLSGERLMLQLQQLEKKFMDENVRQPEITQTFSLAMLSPLELLNLRQTGSCKIKIPEIAFEVLYPGQFRRTIKSVRITIPCVAGPYTNIGAKLTLQKSSIERADDNVITDLPVLPKPESISSSSANSDSGVFDLNFRDERYLPFEGAGAISEWLLELPASIRSFNYDTISDVLLHISYTACESDNRQAAETALATLVTTYAASPGFYRLVSLRYDFPDTLHKLFGQSNQAASFELTPAHFPYLLSSKGLTIVGCKVYVKPKPKTSVSTSTQVTINNASVLFSDSEDIPTVPTDSGKIDWIRGGAVVLAGSPVRIWTINVGGGIAKDDTEDVLILFKYKTP